MRRKLGFLLLVCLFTVFGGGRSTQWAVVCTDSRGYTYEVATNSIKEVSPQVFSLRVKTVGDRGSRTERWTLKTEENILETESFPSEEYGRKSVPHQVEIFLRRRGYLGSVSVPLERGALESSSR